VLERSLKAPLKISRLPGPVSAVNVDVLLVRTLSSFILQMMSMFIYIVRCGIFCYDDYHNLILFVSWFNSKLLTFLFSVGTRECTCLCVIKCAIHAIGYNGEPNVAA
jgi:hypothetical protein